MHILAKLGLQVNSPYKSKQWSRYGKFLVTGVFLLSGAACSSLGVQPWERDVLAEREMLLISNPIESATDEHIYFSKEATSGGQSFGGGGCGCN